MAQKLLRCDKFSVILGNFICDIDKEYINHLQLRKLHCFDPENQHKEREQNTKRKKLKYCNWKNINIYIMFWRNITNYISAFSLEDSLTRKKLLKK